MALLRVYWMDCLMGHLMVTRKDALMADLMACPLGPNLYKCKASNCEL